MAFIWVSIILDEIRKLYIIYTSFGFVLFVLSIGLLIKSSKTLPESEPQASVSLKVTENQDLYSKYIPKVICPYCKCLKKSKKTHHCNICNRCIKGYDHHCYWVNNCVGTGNLKYFLLALTVLLIDSSYTTIIAMILNQSLNSQKKILTSFLSFYSSIVLLAISPFFYLNISNFLTSTTVHKQFSKIDSFLEDSNSIFIEEDPLATVKETRVYSESLSSTLKFNRTFHS